MSKRLLGNTHVKRQSGSEMTANPTKHLEQQRLQVQHVKMNKKKGMTSKVLSPWKRFACSTRRCWEHNLCPWSHCLSWRRVSWALKNNTEEQARPTHCNLCPDLVSFSPALMVAAAILDVVALLSLLFKTTTEWAWLHR